MNRRYFFRPGMTVPLVPLIVGGLSDFDEDFWNEVDQKIRSFQIKVNGRALKDHLALKGRGRLNYSIEYLYFSIAQRWGITPNELSQLSRDDRIDIYAWVMAQWQIEVALIWEQEQRKEWIDSINRFDGGSK